MSVVAQAYWDCCCLTFVGVMDNGIECEFADNTDLSGVVNRLQR